jgi:hypothetical protein
MRHSNIRMNPCERWSFPVANEQTLHDLVAEYKAQAGAYRQQVQKVMRSSYRQILPALLTAEDLRYTRRRYLHKEHMRAAIAHVVNALLHARLEAIWGEATSTCASDSKKFQAVDQNLLTQWHARYHGPGVLVYWHVERRSVCIYSQLKSCTSSEVAAMLEGVLRHCTDMTIKHQVTERTVKVRLGLLLATSSDFACFLV